MIVLDVGANIGTFAVVASARVGATGKVISFEPEERNFSLMKKSVEKNGLANVVMNRAAISDFTGEGKLYLSPNHEGHSLKQGGANPDEPSLGEEMVSVTTVDDTVKKFGLVKVDILKIDVEGSEIKALDGARKTIEGNPTIKLMVDVIHYAGEEKEVSDYLQAMGFKTAFIGDFIFASRA